MNGRDARLNKLGRIVARGRIHGRAIDIQMLFGDQRRAIVHGLAHAVEYAAEHIGRNIELDGFAQKARLGIADTKAL